MIVLHAADSSSLGKVVFFFFFLSRGGSRPLYLSGRMWRPEINFSRPSRAYRFSDICMAAAGLRGKRGIR